METKTTTIRRELLIRLVNEYGNKPKDFVIKKAKERGIYNYNEDDNEVYLLIHAFAKFHNLPFGYIEPEKIIEKGDLVEELVQENIEKEDERDYFYESLLKEHDKTSKKLLALNKLIETYKK